MKTGKLKTSRWYLSKLNQNLQFLNCIWTLARKMTSFRFPENVFVSRVRVGGNTFSVKRPFGQVYYIRIGRIYPMKTQVYLDFAQDRLMCICSWISRFISVWI